MDIFDDGLSAQIALVMRVGHVDYATAREIVHALHANDIPDGNR